MPPIPNAREGIRGGRVTQFIGEALHAQMRFHARQHQRRPEGLGDEVGGPHLERGNLETGLGVTGDEYGGYIRKLWFRLEHSQQLETAHAGHFRVQHHEIGYQLARHTHRVLAVGREAQGGNVPQDGAHELNGARVIVHEQNVLRGFLGECASFHKVAIQQ
jgi:hypothetical protein